MLTSIDDNTVGAGFTPDGVPLLVTVGAGASGGGNPPPLPQPGDWNGLVLDQYSNDRNVSVVNETERGTGTSDDADTNGTPALAQNVGSLAPSELSADDNNRAGIEIHGFINAAKPTDQDVYSFSGTAGTEVWLDIDRTAGSLDTVLELVDIDGNVLATSDNSQDEQFNPDSIGGIGLPLIKDERLGGDFYTTNPKDAGMRVILPPGSNPNGQNTYYVRVSSKDGLTSGAYQLQIRLQQTDEKPGSVVTFADIRYAKVGVQVNGLPLHSPLTGTAGEDSGNNTNGTTGTAVTLGNLLASDQNSISVAGTLTNIPGNPTLTDVDMYQFTINYQDIQQIPGFNLRTELTSAIFDINYADGLARADTSLYVFDSLGRLILTSTGSNIADDQPLPLDGNGLDDPSRGSAGTSDPFIGSQQLAEGTYYVAVTVNKNQATALNQFTAANSASNLLRLQPVQSITRISEDHIGSQGGQTVQDPNTLTTLADLSNENYNTSDPNLVRPTSTFVPWNLGDVSLILSRDTGGGQGNQFYAVDPLTGEFESLIATTGRDIRDIDINRRSDTSTNATGNIVTFSAFSGIADDSATGNFINYDSGNGAQLSLKDDGIITYIDDGTGKPVVPRNGAGDGMNFNALAFSDGPTNADSVVVNGTQLNGGNTRVFGVADRGDHIIDNILYAFLPDGTQINSVFPGFPANKPPNIPVQPTPGPPATRGSAGTNAVELAILDTGDPTGGLVVPDPTDAAGTFGIHDGDGFAINDPTAMTTTYFALDSGPEMTVSSDVTADANISSLFMGGRFIMDGDQIEIDNQVYEFNTGPVIVLPSTTDGQTVSDQDTFTVTDNGGHTVTFEIDKNGAINGNNVRVSVTGSSTLQEIALAIVNAINTTGGNNNLQGVTATVLLDTTTGDYRISLTSVNGVNTSMAAGIDQFGNSSVALGATAINVEETDLTDAIGEAIGTVVNGLPSTGPNGYENGRVDFPTKTDFTTTTVNPGGINTNRGVLVKVAGSTGQPLNSGDGSIGNPYQIDFLADDTPNSLATKIQIAINNQFPGVPTIGGGGDTILLSAASGLLFQSPTGQFKVGSGIPAETSPVWRR